MDSEKRSCSKCHKQRYIVNRTYVLCDDCNRDRLDSQKTPEQLKARSERVLGGMLKNRGFKSKPVKIRSVSKKQAKVESEYEKTIKQIRDELGMEGFHCKNCGGTERLSFSHLSPRSRSPHLVATRSNITIHCMSFGGVVGCHDLWESVVDRVSMSDYEHNMKILREIDTEYYNILRANERSLKRD